MMNAKFITNPKKKNEYKKDKSFITQLCKKYRDEVFTFLCIGANKFYKTKQLKKPNIIRKEEEKYLLNIDAIEEFMRTNTKRKEGNKNIVERSLLFEMYVDWCKETDNKIVKREDFYSALRAKGYNTNKKTNGGILYVEDLIIQKSDLVFESDKEESEEETSEEESEEETSEEESEEETSEEEVKKEIVIHIEDSNNEKDKSNSTINNSVNQIKKLLKKENKSNSL